MSNIRRRPFEVHYNYFVTLLCYIYELIFLLLNQVCFSFEGVHRKSVAPIRQRLRQNVSHRKIVAPMKRRSRPQKICGSTVFRWIHTFFVERCGYKRPSAQNSQDSISDRLRVNIDSSTQKFKVHRRKFLYIRLSIVFLFARY